VFERNRTISWQWDLVQDVTDGLAVDGSNAFGAVVKLFNETLVVTSPDRYGGAGKLFVVCWLIECVVDW